MTGDEGPLSRLARAARNPQVPGGHDREVMAEAAGVEQLGTIADREHDKRLAEAIG